MEIKKAEQGGSRTLNRLGNAILYKAVKDVRKECQTCPFMGSPVL
jgi:hypothetical protein